MGSGNSKPVPVTPPPEPLGPSWREIKWDEWEQMLTKAREYTTDHEQVSKVNLVLAGAVKSGKSSFVNTVDSMFKGRIASTEEAMWHDGAASITKRFRIIKAGGRRGSEVGFNICDTMGMEEEDGLNMDDLPYVLDGHVPDNFVFNAQKRLTSDSKDLVKVPTLQDKMHCLAYVVDINIVFMAPEGIRAKFTRLNHLASARGIRVVCLVTHIDEMCNEVQSDVKNAHNSVLVKKAVDEIHRITGIQRSHIFLVKNYCDEIEVNPDVNALNLTALNKMLDFADDFLDNVGKGKAREHAVATDQQ